MQWIEGVKLTTLAPDEIRDLVKVGQEAFLVQLLEVRRGESKGKVTLRRICDSTFCSRFNYTHFQIGFFHGDPHPGTSAAMLR